MRSTTNISGQIAEPNVKEFGGFLAGAPILPDHGGSADAFYGELVRLHRLSVLGLAAGMIAHEFNNILTPLASYAQMALAEPDDHALSTKALQRCLAASEQTSRVASAILDLVRSAGVPSTVENRADVREGLSTAIECLGRSLEKDGITLTLPTYAEGESGPFAAIEPHALTHAIVNVLINARNAIHRRGSIAIDVTTSAAMPEHDSSWADSRGSTWNTSGSHEQPTTSVKTPRRWVTISIQDSGRGMSPDRLARLFLPPHRRATDRVPNQELKQSAAREHTSFTMNTGSESSGTGLGMGITKHLVEHAGGWITVKSIPGSGTTVRLVLPSIEAA